MVSRPEETNVGALDDARLGDKGGGPPELGYSTIARALRVSAMTGMVTKQGILALGPMESASCPGRPVKSTPAKSARFFVALASRLYHSRGET